MTFSSLFSIHANERVDGRDDDRPRVDHHRREDSKCAGNCAHWNDRCVLHSSRSPSNHRSKRSSPGAGGRRPANDAHRENPIPSAVLGVFGLSQYTNERDLKGIPFDLLPSCTPLPRPFVDLFHKFGRIKDVQIVIDKKTNKSRGFGFVYFEEVESATRVSSTHAAALDRHGSLQAKEALNSVELDHHRLRIDYSVTKRAHTPSKSPADAIAHLRRASSSAWHLHGCSYRFPQPFQRP